MDLKIMFNLRKLMKSVKSGEIYGRYFNANRDKILKANIQLTPLEQAEANEKEELAEEKRLADEQDQLAMQPLSHPVQPVQAIETGEGSRFYEGMMEWFAASRPGLLNGNNELVAGNVPLYRLIREDDRYKKKLEDQLVRVLGIGSSVSSMFVDTMLSKGEEMTGSFDEVSNREEAPTPTVEEVEEVVEEEAVETEESVANNMVNKAVEVFDPTRLSDEKKIEIQNRLHPKLSRFYDMSQLQQAAWYFLAEPEGGAFDKRFSFFLAEENFNLIPLELQAEVRGTSGTASKCRALQGGAGNELLSTLENLIDKQDPRVIEWFLPKFYGEEKEYGENKQFNFLQDSEGKQVVPPASDFIPRDKADEAATPEEIKETSSRVAAFASTFLAGQLDTMESIKESTVQNLMLDNISDYKQAVDALNTPGVKTKRTKAEEKDAVDSRMKDYIRMEGVHAFANYSIDQLGKIFKSPGKGSKFEYKGKGKKGYTAIQYRNEYGSIYVPESILKDIYKPKEDSNEPDIAIDDYQGRSNRYIDSINSSQGEKDYFKPEWAGMVNGKMPYNAYADLYEMKLQIQEMSKYGATPDSIYGHLNNQSATREKLNKFCGVSSRDLMGPNGGGQEGKKKDFIYMTLNQDLKDKEVMDEEMTKKEIEQETKRNPFYMHKQCHDQRKYFKEKREAIDNDKRKSPEEKYEAIRSIRDDEWKGEKQRDEKTGEPLLDKNEKYIRKLSRLKQMKGFIGAAYLDMLPGMIDVLQNSDTAHILNHQATKDFIKLFDHDKSGLERFKGNGTKINENDKRLDQNGNPLLDEKGQPLKPRTNTELYYIIKGMRISDAVQQKIDFHKESLEHPRISKGRSWYNLFFKQIHALDGKEGKIREAENTIQKDSAKKQKYLDNFVKDKVSRFHDDIKSDPKAMARLMENIVKDVEKNYRKRMKEDYDFTDETINMLNPEAIATFKNEMISIATKELKTWDGVKNQPFGYYKWIGLNAPYGKMLKIKNRIDAKKEIIAKIEAEIKKIEIEIKDHLANKPLNEEGEKGRIYDLKADSRVAIAMAHAEYKKACNKIDKLLKMKKLAYKFASIDASGIDNMISSIEKQYDAIFNSLIR